MSSALIRQALDLVDPEDGRKNKRRVQRAPYRISFPNQGLLSHNRRNKKLHKQTSKSQEQIAQENIKKLLALSQPTADSAIAEKIIERAIKGKPLADKIEVKTEEEKSILFPEEETFKAFEKEEWIYMDIADALLGKLILLCAATIFVLLVIWINSYPFIDEDLTIYKYIPNPQWALLACALWGLFFIGGLMAFTLFHIYPYL